MPDQPLSNGALAPGIARGVCRKILSGPTFTKAPRLSRLLESCVEAHAIASRPALDADDRGELKRLSRKLEDYYAAEGASDPVRLELLLPEANVRFQVKDPVADIAAWATAAITAGPANIQAGRGKLWFIAAAIVAIAAALAFGLSRRQETIDPSEVRTIAVLPIDDARPIQLHDKIIPGITASITGELSHVSKWRTIAYTSAVPFGYKAREMSALRSTLNVDAVVEGKLMPSEKSIDGEIWIVRTRDGSRVWRSSFSASRDELLPAIDKAAQEIAAKLGASIPAHALLSPNSGKPPRHAVESYLTARATHQEAPPEMQTALRALESAVGAEPKFAAAQSALAEIWARIVELEYRPLAEAAPKTAEIAQTALKLEPNSAEAHLALGVAAAYSEWDWPAARKEMEHAISLRPSYSYAMSRVAQLEETLGNTKAAVARLEDARSLDPSLQSLNIALGFAYIFDGQHDKALDLMNALEKLDPEYKVIRIVRAMAYFGKKEFARVASHVELMSKMRPWMAPTLGIIAPAAVHLGRPEEARTALKELRNAGKPDPVVLAAILLPLGEDNEAFQLLNQAVDARSTLLLTLPVNPIFERHRNHPRFREIVAKIQRAE
jgi:TolB-like protein/Tfp pilus assembly protein PilF